MKRLFLLSILYVFLLSFTSACRSDKTEPADKEKSTTTHSAADKKNSTALLVTFIELGSVKCVPCRMMQPIMDEIEKEYADQVKVVFHDVWTAEGQPFARQYNIRVIPTQIFLDREGKEYFRHEGFFPKNELIEILERQGVKKSK
ncbi:MAG TPA: thioredoxin family protein [bacterium]|nr:thioredoxin family protein [bacterium]HPG46427.1 thioredoxin family protein [bacterium]HPM98660.1 thioredoxin family protein [bacterium]